MGTEQLGESVAGTPPELQGECSRDCPRGTPQPQEAGGACPGTPAPTPALPTAAHPGGTPQGDNSSPAAGSQALSQAPSCSEQSKAGESWHLVEYAGASNSKCAGCSRPIEAGALRQGARREAGGRITTRWRHWECVTAQVVANIGGLANLRGYTALQQADQELVRTTLASPPKPQRKRKHVDALADCEKEESPAASAAAAPAPAAAASPPATSQPLLPRKQAAMQLAVPGSLMAVVQLPQPTASTVAAVPLLAASPVVAVRPPQPAALPVAAVPLPAASPVVAVRPRQLASSPVAAVRLPLPAASPVTAVRLPQPGGSPVAAVRLPAGSSIAVMRVPLSLLPPVQQDFQRQLDARGANLMRRLVEPPPTDPLRRLARSEASMFVGWALGQPAHRFGDGVEAWVARLGAAGVPGEVAIAELAAELGLA